MPPSYIRVRAVVWAYGRGQTDTQTPLTTIHFASSVTHAKCNNRPIAAHRLAALTGSPTGGAAWQTFHRLRTRCDFLTFLGTLILLPPLQRSVHDSVIGTADGLMRTELGEIRTLPSSSSVRQSR